MTYICFERLIDGVVETLTESVLPELPSRFARGQLFAAVDVLQNLRDRFEEKAVLIDGEVCSLTAALADATTKLRSAGASPLGERLEAQAANAPASPPAERAAALRSVLLSALEALPELDEPAAEGLRSALTPHLTAQTIREVLVRKPSLLRQISEG